MNRFDRADSPTETRDDASSSAQSPQSSTMPSTSASTIDESVHSGTPASNSPSVTEGVKIKVPTS